MFHFHALTFKNIDCGLFCCWQWSMSVQSTGSPAGSLQVGAPCPVVQPVIPTFRPVVGALQTAEAVGAASNCGVEPSVLKVTC